MTTCRECIHKGKSYLLSSEDIVCVVGNELLVGQRWAREWRFKAVLAFMVRALPGAVGDPAEEELQEGSELGAVVKSVLQIDGWVISFLFHHPCSQQIF